MIYFRTYASRWPCYETSRSHHSSLWMVVTTFLMIQTYYHDSYVMACYRHNALWQWALVTNVSFIKITRAGVNWPSFMTPNQGILSQKQTLTTAWGCQFVMIRGYNIKISYICHARSVNLRNLTKSRSQIKDPYIAALFIDALLKWGILHSIHWLVRF